MPRACALSTPRPPAFASRAARRHPPRAPPRVPTRRRHDFRATLVAEERLRQSASLARVVGRAPTSRGRESTPAACARSTIVFVAAIVSARRSSRRRASRSPATTGRFASVRRAGVRGGEIRLPSPPSRVGLAAAERAPARARGPRASVAPPECDVGCARRKPPTLITAPTRPKGGRRPRESSDAARARRSRVVCRRAAWMPSAGGSDGARPRGWLRGAAGRRLGRSSDGEGSSSAATDDARPPRRRTGEPRSRRRGRLEPRGRRDFARAAWRGDARRRRHPR